MQGFLLNCLNIFIGVLQKQIGCYYINQVSVVQMKRLWNRFYDWVFYVSVQRDTANRGKTYQSRYPSPGSVYYQNVPTDYRTPFQETDYNVRYKKLTENQKQQRRSTVIKAADNLSPIKKLVLLKFLKQADANNQTAVSEAKSKFKAAYGFQVDKSSFFKNDVNLHLPENATDRRTINQFYKRYFFQQFARTQNFVRNYSQAGTDSIEHPDILEFNSLDMYDAPHFQQSRIQNEYTLDQVDKARKSLKQGLLTREGSSNFWKALDDSNDPKYIKKVQESIGDEKPTDFRLKDAHIKFEFDKEGNVIGIDRIKEEDKPAHR